MIIIQTEPGAIVTDSKEIYIDKYLHGHLHIYADLSGTDRVKAVKLTPKECWRLQGFSDEQFEKAATVNSNTQLYKQAGNAVTVNVAEAIGKHIVGIMHGGEYE